MRVKYINVAMKDTGAQLLYSQDAGNNEELFIQFHPNGVTITRSFADDSEGKMNRFLPYHAFEHIIYN